MGRHWSGRIEAHGQRLRMRVKLPDGWRWEDTGYAVGQEAMAAVVLARRRAQLQAEEEFRRAAGHDGPATVAQYATRWVAERKARGVDYAWKEEARLRDHILPAPVVFDDAGRPTQTLGEMAIGEVRPRHVRALVKHLRSKHATPRRRRRGAPPAADAAELLAPRTVCSIYGIARQFFREAAADELIAEDPCRLKAGDLPTKRDKVRGWRGTATLDAAETFAMCTDERLAEHRRVQWAMELLTGMRTGEAVARRWRDYDPTAERLGRLTVSTAWNTTRRYEKGTKTERERVIPVHPLLARLLAEWKVGGWARYTGQGRAPKPDDLILPAVRAPMKNNAHSGACWRGDLGALGLRRRRHHDTRRTFISLVRAGGGDEEMAKWITHSPGDVFDDYHSPDWSALCEVVLAIRFPTDSARGTRRG